MEKSRFPISFYHGTGINAFNEQRRRDFEEIGTTLLMLSYGVGDRAKVYELLDWAKGAGIKVMLMDPRTVPWQHCSADADGVLHLDEAAYEQSVIEAERDFGAHPAAFCYYVTDEPDIRNYGASCRASSIVRRVTGKEGHINLRPYHYTVHLDIGTHEYEQYLERFLQDSSCEFLCHDYYAHLSQNDYCQPEFYKNLMLHSRVSRKLGRTMWNVINGSSLLEYREMSYNDLRFQLSCSLAYGSKGVFYFTFDGHCGPSDRFGPLDAWGERTHVYEDMRRVHRELHGRYGDLFLDLKLLKTTHFPRIPQFEVRPFVADEMIAGLNINLHGRNDIHVIISNFVDERSGQKYVYIVNANTKETYCLNVWFTDARRVINRSLTGQEFAQPLTPDADTGRMRTEMFLAPGQGDLLRIE